MAVGRFIFWGLFLGIGLAFPFSAFAEKSPLPLVETYLFQPWVPIKTEPLTPTLPPEPDRRVGPFDLTVTDPKLRAEVTGLQFWNDSLFIHKIKAEASCKLRLHRKISLGAFGVKILEADPAPVSASPQITVASRPTRGDISFLKIPFPSSIPMRLIQKDKKMTLVFADPQSVKDHLNKYIDGAFSPAGFDQLFYYRLTGLNDLEKDIAEWFIEKEKTEILSKFRDELKKKINTDEIWERWLNDVVRSFPPALLPDNGSMDLVLEKQNYPIPTWRIRSGQPSTLSPVALKQILSSQSAQKWNGVSLVQTQDSLQTFFEAYAAQIQNGKEKIFGRLIPEENKPYLGIVLDEGRILQGMAGLFNKLSVGFLPSLDTKLVLFTSKPYPPRAVLWYLPQSNQGRREFIDLFITLGSVQGESVQPLELWVTFELVRGGTLHFRGMRSAKTGSATQLGDPDSASAAVLLAELCRKWLLSAEFQNKNHLLPESVRPKDGNGFEFKGLRLIGDGGPRLFQGREIGRHAEALCIEFISQPKTQ